MSIIVSCARGHNSSTTLMIDGEIIFYLEEERLTRLKYDGSPLVGLTKVFDYVDHIDDLVICHTHDYGADLDWCGGDVYTGLVRKLARRKFTFNVHHINEIHHEMHASAAFYNSGFETAAILVADGAGSFLKVGNCKEPVYEFESIFKAKYPYKIEQVYKHLGTQAAVGCVHLEDQEGGNVWLTEYPGHTKMYEAVTEYCGWEAIEAGKTMGLAPYGKPNDEIPSFFTEDGWGNRDLIIPTYPNAAQLNIGRYPKLFKEDLKKRREGEYTDLQKDLAYKIQEQSSDRMCDLIQKTVDLTGEKNICISGGYGLNCVANYKYWERFPDLNIYCEPISHDGGTSVGGAYYTHYNETGDRTPRTRTSVYYGPQYDPKSYEDQIKDLELKDVTYDDVAALIREGNIVTIFQGKSEGGPRALGNRSILFDPTIKDGKDIVNKVKHREWFRPFACSIKEEKVHEWFDLKGRDKSPFMMYAVRCHEGIEEKIPSVIHVDGTCRIQTVTEEENKHYYNLIDAFEKITDVPILFNTSFNLGGDPLVETIEDALDTLNRSDIEYMYLPEIGKLVKVPNDGIDKSNTLSKDKTNIYGKLRKIKFMK